MGLGKMARGQIPNPHRGVHPPNSFYIFYTVEYQCFRMFTLSKSEPKRPQNRKSVSKIYFFVHFHLFI